MIGLSESSRYLKQYEDSNKTYLMQGDFTFSWLYIMLKQPESIDCSFYANLRYVHVC